MSSNTTLSRTLFLTKSGLFGNISEPDTRLNVLTKSNLVSEIKCSLRNWTQVLSNPTRLKPSNVAPEIQQGLKVPQGVVNFKRMTSCFDKSVVNQHVHNIKVSESLQRLVNANVIQKNFVNGITIQMVFCP
jgi:hypothetical protein